MLSVTELGVLQKRVSLLNQNPAGLCSELASLAEAKKDVTTEQRREWLIKASRNHSELAAAVVTNVSTDVLAHLFALGFFQEVTLGPSDWPILQTDKRDKNYTCTYLGEDGLPKRKQRVSRRDHSQYLMQKYTTEEVEYPLMNLQTGDVSELDRVQRELAYEIRLGVDNLARALLDAGTYASGLRATLNLHSSIVTANIPDKNYYDESANDSGTLTIAKLKDILDYYVRFANDVELDGMPLTIKTIYMSSTMIRNIWDFVTLVAGYDSSGTYVQDPKSAVPASMQEGIYTSGKINSVFGYPINIVARNTITAPYLYIASNKPCGFLWRKPAFDEVWANNDPNYRRQNKGSLQMAQCLAMAMPSEWAYRYMKVKC